MLKLGPHFFMRPCVADAAISRIPTIQLDLPSSFLLVFCLLSAKFLLFSDCIHLSATLMLFSVLSCVVRGIKEAGIVVMCRDLFYISPFIDYFKETI